MSLKFWSTYPFFYPDISRPYHEIVSEVIDVAQAAEDLGFEGISFPEHHFFNYICNPSALQYATLVAAKTERLRILTGVIVLPYYHPLALAEEIALVDHISKGRLEIGVARGANKYEYDRLGIDWRNSRSMYEESLDIILRAWTESDITGNGQYWPFPAVTAIPRPYQQPYPKVWVSAQSQNGVTAAGAAGLNMMTSPNLGCFAPHGDLEQAMQWYNDASASSGHERGDVMVLRRVFIDTTEQKALAQLNNVHHHWSYYMSQFKGTPARTEDRFRERTENEKIVVREGSIQPIRLEIERDNVYETYDDPILTDPARAIERFKKYERLGVNHVMALTAFGADIKDVIRSMEIMAKEVFPAFADSPAEAARSGS